MTGRSALPLDASDFGRRLAEARDGRVSWLGRSLPCSAWDRWVLVAILAAAYGSHFTPPASLVAKAEAGETYG